MRIKTADEFTDLQMLLHQVRTMPCDESAKRQFLGLLQAQEGKVIRFTKRDLSRPEQVHRAAQLLQAGYGMGEARKRLVSLYGCSTRHAYNLIREALDQR